MIKKRPFLVTIIISIPLIVLICFALKPFFTYEILWVTTNIVNRVNVGDEFDIKTAMIPVNCSTDPSGSNKCILGATDQPKIVIPNTVIMPGNFLHLKVIHKNGQVIEVQVLEARQVIDP